MQKKTTEQFIKDSEVIHNFKYDYSKTEYVNARTKVCIICPEHGEFWQTPNHHLYGCGCPLCRNNIKSTTTEFIEKSKQVHNYKYDYSKTEYVNARTKVCIICPEHGEFWQLPSEHLRGHSCPKCGLQSISAKNSKNINDYLNKCIVIHNNKYDYTQSEYINYATKVCIICPEHGKFYQNIYDHSCGHGCPKCANQQSSGEMEIIEYIKENIDDEIVIRDTKIIYPNELDIYIPSHCLAIEYNGMIWHSEKFGKDKTYHLNKTEKCQEKGIRLIHIFENEWLEHKEIVKSKIRHLLNKDNNLNKIFARRCIIKEINKDISREFLEKNHIQGSCSATIHLGCYFNTELIGVITFKKESKDENNHNWELTRFATNINKHCIGIGGKLFKYFIRNYNPSYIKSFADRRWTLDKDNNLYTKLGFKLDKVLKPDYRYTKGANSYIHKFNFRKQTLLKRYPDSGLTEDMTEYEMTQKLGFYRIWDCGLFKYVWKY